MEKLNEILTSEYDSSSFEIQEKIIKSLTEHKGKASQNDDITFVLVKVESKT